MGRLIHLNYDYKEHFPNVSRLGTCLIIPLEGAGRGGGLANYHHKAWESKASQNAPDPEHDIQQSPPKNGETRHTIKKKQLKTRRTCYKGRVHFAVSY